MSYFRTAFLAAAATMQQEPHSLVCEDQKLKTSDLVCICAHIPTYSYLVK